MLLAARKLLIADSDASVEPYRYDAMHLSRYSALDSTLPCSVLLDSFMSFCFASMNSGRAAPRASRSESTAANILIAS